MDKCIQKEAIPFKLLAQMQAAMMLWQAAVFAVSFNKKLLMLRQRSFDI